MFKIKNLRIENYSRDDSSLEVLDCPIGHAPVFLKIIFGSTAMTTPFACESRNLSWDFEVDFRRPRTTVNSLTIEVFLDVYGDVDVVSSIVVDNVQVVTKAPFKKDFQAKGFLEHDSQTPLICNFTMEYLNSWIAPAGDNNLQSSFRSNLQSLKSMLQMMYVLDEEGEFSNLGTAKMDDLRRRIKHVYNEQYGARMVGTKQFLNEKNEKSLEKEVECYTEIVSMCGLGYLISPEKYTEPSEPTIEWSVVKMMYDMIICDSHLVRFLRDPSTETIQKRSTKKKGIAGYFKKIFQNPANLGSQERSSLPTSNLGSDSRSGNGREVSITGEVLHKILVFLHIVEEGQGRGDKEGDENDVGGPGKCVLLQELTLEAVHLAVTEYVKPGEGEELKITDCFYVSPEEGGIHMPIQKGAFRCAEFSKIVVFVKRTAVKETQRRKKELVRLHKLTKLRETFRKYLRSRMVILKNVMDGLTDFIPNVAALRQGMIAQTESRFAKQRVKYLKTEVDAFVKIIEDHAEKRLQITKKCGEIFNAVLSSPILGNLLIDNSHRCREECREIVEAYKQKLYDTACQFEVTDQAFKDRLCELMNFSTELKLSYEERQMMRPEFDVLRIIYEKSDFDIEKIENCDTTTITIQSVLKLKYYLHDFPAIFKQYKEDLFNFLQMCIETGKTSGKNIKLVGNEIVTMINHILYLTNNVPEVKKEHFDKPCIVQNEIDELEVIVANAKVKAKRNLPKFAEEVYNGLKVALPGKILGIENLRNVDHFKVVTLQFGEGQVKKAKVHYSVISRSKRMRKMVWVAMNRQQRRSFQSERDLSTSMNVRSSQLKNQIRISVISDEVTTQEVEFFVKLLYGIDPMATWLDVRHQIRLNIIQKILQGTELVEEFAAIDLYSILHLQRGFSVDIAYSFRTFVSENLYSETRGSGNGITTTNFEFVCNDGGSVEVHKEILVCNCAYFRKFLREEDNLTLEKMRLHASHFVVTIVVEFIYQGKVDFNEHDPMLEDLLDLFFLSRKLELTKLLSVVSQMISLKVGKLTSEEHKLLTMDYFERFSEENDKHVENLRMKFLQMHPNSLRHYYFVRDHKRSKMTELQKSNKIDTYDVDKLIKKVKKLESEKKEIMENMVKRKNEIMQRMAATKEEISVLQGKMHSYKNNLDRLQKVISFKEASRIRLLRVVISLANADQNMTQREFLRFWRENGAKLNVTDRRRVDGMVKMLESIQFMKEKFEEKSQGIVIRINVVNDNLNPRLASLAKDEEEIRKVNNELADLKRIELTV